MSLDRKKRLTPREWSKAEAMYESGEYTLEQISEEFGVHVITAQRHMSKNGIEKGSKAQEIKDAVTNAIANETAEEVSLQAKRIQETKEEHYRISQAIDKRLARELILSEQEGRPIAAAMGNVKVLKTMAETLKLTREARYQVLGITDADTDDDELPDLEVREMLDEEVRAIRDAQIDGQQPDQDD